MNMNDFGRFGAIHSALYLVTVIGLGLESQNQLLRAWSPGSCQLAILSCHRCRLAIVVVRALDDTFGEQYLGSYNNVPLEYDSRS